MKSLNSLMALSCLLVTQEAQSAPRIVAASGQAAPGTAGAFNQIYWSDGNPIPAIPPSLSDSGHVAFAASLTNNVGNVRLNTDTGIWTDHGSSLSMLVREGFQAPGAPAGAVFHRATNPIVNSSGAVAFHGLLRANIGGITVNDNIGVWSSGEGPLTILARKGFQAPGTEPGVNFLTLGDPNLSDSGGTAFYGTLSGTGVTTENSTGIWASRAGQLDMIVRAGSQAPGMPAGVMFSHYHFPTAPFITDSGQVSFVAKVIGPGINLGNDFSIWSERDGQLALLAREGDQAPGFPTGTTYSFDVRDVHFDRSGRYALRANVGLTGSAIFSESNDALRRAVATGDVAPGAMNGAIFSLFESPVVNSAGAVAFAGRYQAPDGGSGNGVWVKIGDQLRNVALQRGVAPGSNLYFHSFEHLAFNDAGQVAFVAEMMTLGGSQFKKGLFATTPAGELRQIALVDGNSLPILAQAGGIAFNGSWNYSVPHRSGFNDRGEISYLAFSADQTYAIVSDAVALDPSDFNGDGLTDGADFLAWQRGRGKATGALPADGDADRDGDVDAADLAAWRSAFSGANSATEMAVVPEPATGALVTIGAVGLLIGARRHPVAA